MPKDSRLEFKVQEDSISRLQKAIDTPGEYLENRSYYKALIVTSVDADIIALVCDCTAEEDYIAPGFCSMFAKDCIGIVTKIDIANSEDKIEHARDILRKLGSLESFK